MVLGLVGLVGALEVVEWGMGAEGKEAMGTVWVGWAEVSGCPWLAESSEAAVSSVHGKRQDKSTL